MTMKIWNCRLTKGNKVRKYIITLVVKRQWLIAKGFGAKMTNSECDCYQKLASGNVDVTYMAEIHVGI